MPLLDALLEANRPHLPRFFDGQPTVDRAEHVIGRRRRQLQDRRGGRVDRPAGCWPARRGPGVVSPLARPGRLAGRAHRRWWPRPGGQAGVRPADGGLRRRTSSPTSTCRSSAGSPGASWPAPARPRSPWCATTRWPCCAPAPAGTGGSRSSSGAGINAVGVHPSGRTAGFLALGDYTGDSGGGIGLGVAGARRGGPGPRRPRPGDAADHVGAGSTSGCAAPEDVAVAVHTGRSRTTSCTCWRRWCSRAAADGDAVAAGIVDAFADEVAVMATALIRRLRLTRTDVEVVLGGGTLQTGNGGAARPGHRRDHRGGAAGRRSPCSTCRRSSAPWSRPWTTVGAPAAALRRIRRALVTGR